MRKRVLAAGIVGLIVTAAAGCAQGGDDSAQGASQAPTAATSTAASSSPAASAAGSPAAAATQYFETEVTPKTAVAPGTVLTAKSTGATPSTAYYCLIAAYDTTGGGVSAADRASLKPVRSNADGEITCEVTYKPFSTKDTKGETRHCPTTAADREAKFACGVLLADAATLGALSGSAAPFTPKK